MTAPTSYADPNFPKPLRKNGRLYWWRSEIERYKTQLLHEALAERLGTPVETAEQPPRTEPDSLVPSKTVAAEFGFCRRTLGRLVFEPPSADNEAAA